ncbi:MAG: SPOR domain-containing protein [Pseudomonadota bacterium]
MKQRLVGAAVLMALGIIFIPIFLAPDDNDNFEDDALKIERTAEPEEFSSKVSPIDDELVEEMLSADKPAEQVIDRAVMPPSSSDGESETNKEFGSDSTASEAPSADVSERVGMTAWVVQVGSFGNKDNAEKLVGKLRGKAYSAFIDEINGEKTVFKVRIGPLLSKARAEQTADSLKKKLDIDSLVVEYR